MQSIIAGRAYVLGDNVDTDQIIPAQYLTFNPATLDLYLSDEEQVKAADEK